MTVQFISFFPRPPSFHHNVLDDHTLTVPSVFAVKQSFHNLQHKGNTNHMCLEREVKVVVQKQKLRNYSN